MNNKKLALFVIIAIILFAMVYLLYNSLSDKYASPVLPDTQITEQTDKEGTTDSPAPQRPSVPDFTVFDDEGKSVRFSDFSGKPVVISFWATWCHYCKEGMPAFEKLCKEYPDVHFMMINATDNDGETMERAMEYIKEKGYTFPHFYDNEQAAQITFGISALPTTFFVDKEGLLVTYANGMLDYENLKKAIDMITK